MTIKTANWQPTHELIGCECDTPFAPENTHTGHIGSCCAWVCVCGNQTNTEGFYPCDINGTQVEPTPDEWPSDLYVCDRCGRIYEAHTGAFKAWRTYTSEEWKELRRGFEEPGR